jgi:signal transduction histidine kinase
MKKYRVLLVEDNAADARLISEYLKEGKDTKFKLVHVERLTKGLALLHQKKYDIILLDLSLPDSDGSETINKTLKASSKIPIIVLTGRNDEEFAVESVRTGAQDYLVKGQFDGTNLIRSIKYAIERKRLQEELKESEERAEFYKDIITHDMNTFLKNLLSSVFLLNLYIDNPKVFIDNPKNPNNLREILNIIGDQVYRAINVVSNVEELSKLQDLEESMEKLDLKEIIIESLEFITKTFKGKKIETSVNLPKEHYFILGNDLLSNVLEIIFYNSIKFNENNIVKINIDISSKQIDNSEYYRINIEDNGIGIKDSDKEKIFESKIIEEGTEVNQGQGFFLARKIIKNHKGFIRIDNKVKGNLSEGSKFILLLPRYNQN